MELNQLVTDLKSGIEAFKTSATNDIQAQKQAIADLTAKFDQLGKLDGMAKAEDVEQIKKDLNTLIADFAENGKGAQKQKTFKGSFSDGIEVIKDNLASFAKTKSKLDINVELKDMDFDNFSAGALEALTTEVLPGVYSTAWSQLWLRNIFRNASTTSGNIKYIQEDNTENAKPAAGAVDIWDGSKPIAELLAKADLEYNFNDEDVAVQWIAGTVRLKREMLDDIAFLRSYIPQQLVYGKRGIFVRENTLILATMNQNSIAYDGSKTLLVEKLVDAVLGQMKDHYHTANYILMNNRDEAEIIFNKATGSGEYDLPSVVQVNPVSGQLTIAGIPVIGLPQFQKGTAFVVDTRESLFVSRMEPEVRFFEEDRDNVIKNLITIRGEERAAHLVFDKTSIIKVTNGTT